MGIIAALLIFSLLVLIHEFGHFIVAKKSGVKIHEFAIGMGPKLFGKQKGDTLYSIRLFPIGGYVRMEGEDEESESENSFSKKSLLARASIVFAGPFVNIVTAIVSFTIVYMLIGVQTTTVNNVLKGSLADSMGMQKGDQILYVNDNKVKDFEDIVNIKTKEDGTVDFVVKRDGKEKKLKLEILNESTLGIEIATEKNLVKAIEKGFKISYDYTKEMLSSLWKVATGWITKDSEKVELSGPIGIVNVISDVVTVQSVDPTLKVANIFNIFAILSLNLGVINLIPFPALDGSRLLFMFVEFIRGGKKINNKVESLFYLIGFGLLMLLMIFITIKDVMKLF